MKRLIIASTQSAPDLGKWSEFYKYASLQDIDDLGDDTSNYISKYTGAFFHIEDETMCVESGLDLIGVVVPYDHLQEDLENNGLDVLIAVFSSRGELELVIQHQDRLLPVSLSEVTRSIPGYGLEPDLES